MLATEARTLAGASSSRRRGQQRTLSLLLFAWLALSAVCQAEYPAIQLQIRVTPTSVRLSAGGKPVLDWTGDPNRLSLDSDWETPRKDWLFLASSEMKARVAALTLTSTAGEQ